jgi:hypothetical protein
VTSTRTEAAAAVRISVGLALRTRIELLGLLRPCFARTEPWLQAGKYLSALASELPRVNGWSIARRGGDRGPDRTQRLLNHAAWDTSAAMSVVRRFAVRGLDAAARRGGMVIGAIDETGQEKAGQATAEVKRQYLGCAGKVANGINTVHLSYVREKAGHALIGARQWIPREQIEDPVRSLVMGLPQPDHHGDLRLTPLPIRLQHRHRPDGTSPVVSISDTYPAARAAQSHLMSGGPVGPDAPRGPRAADLALVPGVRLMHRRLVMRSRRPDRPARHRPRLHRQHARQRGRQRQPAPARRTGQKRCPARLPPSAETPGDLRLSRRWSGYRGTRG